MANIIFGKFIEDVKKRTDIRYYSSFEEMDATLKYHPDSAPRIINENLVQVQFEEENNFT